MGLKRSNRNRDADLSTADSEFQQFLVNSDERAGVIVGSVMLEQRLSEYLHKIAVQDSKLISTVLDRGNGEPLLGSFASKIRILEFFGKLSGDEVHDLDVIRDIRNDFAHNIRLCSFSDPEVVAHVSKLIIGWNAVKNRNTPPRIVFNVEIYSLYTMIGQRMSAEMPAVRPSDWRIG